MRIWCKFEFRWEDAGCEQVCVLGCYDLVEALDHFAWISWQAASFEAARKQRPGLVLEVLQTIPGDEHSKRRPAEIHATVVL